VQYSLHIPLVLPISTLIRTGRGVSFEHCICNARLRPESTNAKRLVQSSTELNDLFEWSLRRFTTFGFTSFRTEHMLSRSVLEIVDSSVPKLAYLTLRLRKIERLELFVASTSQRAEYLFYSHARDSKQ
jgi:hypothetical protein